MPTTPQPLSSTIPTDVRVSAALIALVGICVLGVAGYAIVFGERRFAMGFALMALTGCLAFPVAAGLTRFELWAWRLSVAGSAMCSSWSVSPFGPRMRCILLDTDSRPALAASVGSRRL